MSEVVQGVPTRPAGETVAAARGVNPFRALGRLLAMLVFAVLAAVGFAAGMAWRVGLWVWAALAVGFDAAMLGEGGDE